VLDLVQPEISRGGFDESRSALVGREHEVGELRGALQVALGGCGRIVLLEGEPGIGTPRLANRLANEAAARGVPVWWGRSWEDGSAPTFWPWNLALRGWIDRAGSEPVSAAAGTWIAELARVFPVLGDRLPGLPPTEESESDRARFRLFDSVSRFLAEVAAPAGLVVVLDDLHWADRPSLKLLEFIATDLRDRRVLIVGTYRDTEVSDTDPFSATLCRLARESSTQRLFLTGLSPAQCAQWAAPLIPVPTDAEALGAALHRETNGNPFFLGEIVRLLASEGGIKTGWDARRIPHGVREVVSRRLDRLGAACRGALTVAALLGDTIDPTILREILDDKRTADFLHAAVRDRLLIESGNRRPQYGFAHALVRRVLADELQPSVRADWHARIAAVLERRTAERDVVTAELVHHFAAAETPETLRKAFDHACRGAEEAVRGLGWEEAVRLYTIALDVGQRCQALDSERALELRLALARALRGAGDVAAARQHCEEVLAACRRAPRPALVARAALLHAGPMPEHGRVDPTERAVLEEACRHVEGIGDGLRARLSARLAGDLIAANEVDQGARVVTLCDEAVRAARQAGDAGALAMALFASYYAAALRMRPREGSLASCSIPSPEEILEAAETGGMHAIAAAIRHLRALGSFAMGDAEAFAAEIDGLATAATASRAPEAFWLADALAALRATVEGRFAEGRDLMDRALATGRRMQLPNAVGTHVSQRIMWHALQGRLAEIVGEIDAFVDGHPGGHGWRPLRALAHLACGDTVRGRAEFQGLLAVGLGPAESGVMSRCYLAGLAFLCVALRDREHAPMLYDRVARQRQTWSVDGCQTLGPWSLACGALARLCDRPQDAERHFRDAVAQARRMRSRPFLTEALSLLASLKLSMDRRGEERDRVANMLAEAQASARELGLAGASARIARLMTKLAGRGGGANVFRHDGDFWTVRYRNRELRLKDGKGPRYLAILLAASGREFHVLQLAGGAPAAGVIAGVDGLSVASPEGALDDGPDARARREYRARLGDLQAELDEAERFFDSGRAERLRAEFDALVSELARHLGAHAHLRGPAEAARKAVTKVLRTQIGKLLDLYPALGEHLRDAVRMGGRCVYAPRTPTSWEVSFGPSP
jgi:hypothetical protein